MYISTTRGAKAPFLFAFFSMDLKTKILAFVESCLERPEHFVVSVSISASKRPTVAVVLDGDKGVDIDTCSKVSRALGAWIEENNLFEQAYILEVGSPGVDSPLVLPRQFLANVGRKVQLTLKDGSQIEGRLTEYSLEKMTLQPDAPKKAKSPLPQPIEIQTDNVKTAIVKVEF